MDRPCGIAQMTATKATKTAYVATAQSTTSQEFSRDRTTRPVVVTEWPDCSGRSDSSTVVRRVSAGVSIGIGFLTALATTVPVLAARLPFQVRKRGSNRLTPNRFGQPASPAIWHHAIMPFGS